MRFNEAEIVESYKLREVIEIYEKGRLLDFLPRIYPSRKVSIAGLVQRQQEVLDAWKNHFESLGIPYVITKQQGAMGDRYTLWKERRV